MKIMQLKNLLGILLLISVLFITPTAGERQNNQITLDTINTITVINGDAELNDTSISGLGTDASPFILEFNIGVDNSSDLVTITSTSLHFVIQNSVLHGGSWGIIFNDVQNGRIEGSDIYENDAGGIQFTESNENTIFDNDIYNNVEVGISFINSNANMVDDNDIYGHDAVGLGMLDLSQHTGGSGVILDPSDHNVFYKNTIYDNAEYGIHGLDSDNATVEENTIYGNNIGVRFDFMTNSNISSNNIYGHDEFGIYIENSKNIVILNNTFSDNTDGNLFVNNDNSSITEVDTEIATTILTDDELPYPEITFVFSLILISIGMKSKRRK